MQNEKKSQIIGFRVTLDEKQAIERAAWNEDRKVANFAYTATMNRVNKKQEESQ